MGVNIINSEPVDGRAWTVVDPVDGLEGMGWHIVRIEEDCVTMTTMAVADSESEAVAYFLEQHSLQPQTEVGEEAIDEMVAVKCVACSHIVTDRDTMTKMWCIDTACPKCGDGALLWDDGSLGLVDDLGTDESTVAKCERCGIRATVSDCEPLCSLCSSDDD